MPEGTFEREISKEGFFGPAAFIHHRRPPTGWTSFEGAAAAARLRPDRAERGRKPRPGTRRSCWPTPRCELRFWKLGGADAGAGPQRRRRPAAVRPRRRGRPLLRLRPPGAFEPATTSTCRAGRCGGSRRSRAAAILMIEATNAHFTLPERGFWAARVVRSGDARHAGDGRRRSAPTRRWPASSRSRSRSAGRSRSRPTRTIRSTRSAGTATLRRCGSTCATSARWPATATTCRRASTRPSSRTASWSAPSRRGRSRPTPAR